MKLTESDVEEAAIAWLQSLGYAYAHGPSLTSGAVPERASHTAVLLEGRLRSAVARINPGLTPAQLDEVVRQVTTISGPDPVANNHTLHRLLTRGVTLEHRKGGHTRGLTAWLVDFSDADRNDWLVVNQLTVVGHQRRRPDLVVYLNGLPVAVFELKDPTAANAKLKRAWNQLQQYTRDIPDLFTANLVCVVGDGIEAKVGSLTAPWGRFGPWRIVDGPDLAPSSMPQLEVLVRGLFDRQRLLDYLRFFVLWESAGGLVKKTAGYHQFHAVNQAVDAAVEACAPDGDRRIGVVWHTQGSGKSVSMAFFAAKLIEALGNPTLLVVTDRNDLDDQLHDQFAAARDLLPEPDRATSRLDLRDKLAVVSGGIVFSTMQMFGLTPDEKRRGAEFPVLTERTDVVVIADEAHRTQYGFDKKVTADGKVGIGFARNLRQALPHASFVGFTGTPVELEDRSTPEVFGPYIDVYPISRAVQDGSTVPIYYEARLAQLDLPADEKPQLDEGFDDVTEAEDDPTKAKLQRRWSRLEAVVGTRRRLRLVARDILEHYRRRTEIIAGKAMVVTISRPVAVHLYKELVRLRPEWHTDSDDTGRIKLIMTGSADDPAAFAPHIRPKQALKGLARRFKNPDDPLCLVLVVDMWLTGFDAPCCHTMYLDKPLRGHTLMQAIARVNRVYQDKPSGLVVDYLGVATDLKKAVKWYDRTGARAEQAAVPMDLAVAELEKRVDIVRGMLHAFDRSGFFGADPSVRVATLAAGADHVLGLNDGKKRFREAMLALNKAAGIALHDDRARHLVDDVAFFQAVQQTLAKHTTPRGASSDALDAAIRQIVARAVQPGKVIDILESANLPNPDISVLSEAFLAEVQASPHRNLQLETLKKLLKDRIRALGRRNVVQAGKFSERLAAAIQRYQNRAVDSAAVIQVLVDLARDLREQRGRGTTLGLTDDEMAFYDALAEHEQAREVFGDEKLAGLARELLDSVRRTVSIDWTAKEQVKAKLRTRVKHLLRRRKYPPDEREDAVHLILVQAETLARDWGEEGPPAEEDPVEALPLAAEGSLAYAVQPAPVPQSAPFAGLWQEVAELLEEPALEPVLHTLHAAGLVAPEPGYEFKPGKRVITQVELAWPSQRVAVALPSQLTGGADTQLVEAGWTVFTWPFEANALVAALR